MLVVDSVQKSFGSRRVLNDISLKLDKGEIVCLLGRNGSGKSTLLEIITGCTAADHKYIKIDDRVVQKQKDLNKAIRYLPTGFFLPKKLTVRAIIRLLPANQQTRVSHFLTREIADFSLRVQNLSFGQQRWLSVLFILGQPGAYKILDEPFSGISPILCERLEAILNEMKTETGILIVDHATERAAKLSDRVYFLKNGSLRELHSPEASELFGHYK